MNINIKKSPLYLILCLLLLSPKIAFATNYSYSISQTDFDFLENNFLSMKNTMETYISLNSDNLPISSDYCIWVVWNTLYGSIIPNNQPLIAYFPSRASWQPFAVDTNPRYYSGTFSSDYSTFIYDSTLGFSGTQNFYGSGKYYYCSRNAYFSSNVNNTYTFTYNNNTLSVNNSTTEYLPSLYDLYTTWIGPLIPPEPTDDTPLLTAFVSTTLDGLSVISDFIISSYIYLSIFVVFILTFVILLIRRLR